MSNFYFCSFVIEFLTDEDHFDGRNVLNKILSKNKTYFVFNFYENLLFKLPCCSSLPVFILLLA